MCMHHCALLFLDFEGLYIRMFPTIPGKPVSSHVRTTGPTLLAGYERAREATIHFKQAFVNVAENEAQREPHETVCRINKWFYFAPLACVVCQLDTPFSARLSRRALEA